MHSVCANTGYVYNVICHLLLHVESCEGNDREMLVYCRYAPAMMFCSRHGPCPLPTAEGHCIVDISEANPFTSIE